MVQIHPPQPTLKPNQFKLLSGFRAVGAVCVFGVTVLEIRMTPQTEGKKGYYVAEGEWNLLGGYGEEPGNATKRCIRMVAGEGFEPSTFGL